MAAWITYLKERFPLPVYVLLIGGFCLSGAYLMNQSIVAPEFTLSFIGLFLFFALLRLMDERKDYDKDLVAHPERPLPRGVLSIKQVDQAIIIMTWMMIAYSGMLYWVVNPVSSIVYGVITGHLWLMYKEFYVGDRLEKSPILYAITHQLIILPICLFCVIATQPSLWDQPITWYYGMAVLGAFFSYEVCRKLDPSAHPILKTYLYIYGPKGTTLLVIATTLVATVGAFGLDLHTTLLPFQILLVASLALLWVKPQAFKAVEGLATLSLLAHLWSIPVHYWIKN